MKKKIFMLLLCFMSAAGASAQFEKGKFYVNAGFSGFDLNYQNEWNFGINAKAGYMFTDDVMVLADGLWNIRQHNPNDFRLGAGLRYYIVQNGLYLGAGARYKHASCIDDFMPNVNVGYAFFLNKTVTLEPELYFDFSTKNFKDYSDFGLRIGIGIYFDTLF